MNVRQMCVWLSKFEDQDATVLVVEHSWGYYDQGGTATIVTFDPEKHADYTDFRENQFVSNEHKNGRTLLLGAIDK
jgi:hypothetical protein